MPTLDEACTALAAAVDGISGIRAKGYIDDITNPPEAQVFSREFDPRMVFGDGKRTWQLAVLVAVPRNTLRAAHKTLRGLMEPSGSGSVRAKIEDESSWTGATIDYAEVTQIGQPFELEQAGVIYLAVNFDVDVCW